MAPKKGTKRTAAAVDVEAVAEAKRMKDTLKTYGVSKTLYDGVVEALQHPLADVPHSAREMLIASVLQGICVPENQRHEFQSAYVEMVAQTLQGVLSKLKVKVDDATAEVSRIEEGKTQLQAQVQERQEALEKAIEGEKKGKEDLAEATRVALDNKTALAKQEKLQTEGDAAHEAAKAEKKALEAVLSEEFRALRDGAVEGAEAKAQYQTLAQLAKSSGLENTLLAALPSSLLKLPAERGSFDAMVLAQLQEGLSKRCSELESQILQGEPAAQERLKAVQVAMQDLEASRVHQEKMAEAFRETQNVLKSCQEAKKEAEQKVDGDMETFIRTLRDHTPRMGELPEERTQMGESRPIEVEDAEPTLQAAQKVLEDANSELEQYQNYNWTCFEKLRSRTIVEEPEAEVAAAPIAKDVEVPAATEAAVATAGA